MQESVFFPKIFIIWRLLIAIGDENGFQLPSDVNQRLITFVNETIDVAIKSLCYFSYENKIDCQAEQLRFIYL